MYQLEVSLCHALNSNNLFLRYPAGSIYIFSDLKEIKTAGKERKRSGKKENEVKKRAKIKIQDKISSKYLLNLLAAAAAAAAKSLQLCLTLCNPIHGSPPGSPVPGILQARTMEWVAISFSNA